MTIYVASRSICSVLCNGTKNVDNEISVSSTAFIRNANKKRLGMKII
jgi:hypothetical protein